MASAMIVDSVSPLEPSKYDQVQFKKWMGRLIVTSQQLSFETDGNGANGGANGDGGLDGNSASFPWNVIVKHQISPVSYPKAMLKLVLTDGKSATFRLPNRNDLERIRKDIGGRLRSFRSKLGSNGGDSNLTAASGGRKRSHSEMRRPGSSSSEQQRSAGGVAGIGELDPTALAVTRSSLLAANPAIRSQHQFLVEETKTVDENDFWATHAHLVQEEYAKICGMFRAGTSSLLQSQLPLQGRVTLGVEEMRQIFILYPAVHKAYEEKVPLELSDEQFWRKYLESEYFHRDRGRLGTAARNHAEASVDKDKANRRMEEENARAAAVSTDDLFSRYDQKLQEESGQKAAATARKWGNKLAVGQFDLASTFETERGDLLEGPKDNHPPNAVDDGKGAKVIQKYNRHWAMVLHPEEAVAGSNLMEIARRSYKEVLENDEDSKANGGLDSEMMRLVGYAEADPEDANHALGTGLTEDHEDEQLTLKNVENYYTGQLKKESTDTTPDEEAIKRQAFFSKALSTKMQALMASATKTPDDVHSFFPPPQLGKELLSALTKKMAQDCKTDAATLEVVNTLPEDFKKRLHSYFRRSSELLRHFFGLRKLAAQGSSKKIARIVEGMETLYREMEGMRKDLPQTETGETMRKMCLPIMDQLDWAFKLYREGMGGAGKGGGFVSVEEEL